jgi:hypothetical protein
VSPENALILIPDTNVWMAHAERPQAADWMGMVASEFKGREAVRLVVPLLVIDELDDPAGQFSGLVTRGGRA